MSEGTPRKNIPKEPKPFWGKVFDPLTKGADNVRIIIGDAAVAIIEYYAFEKNSDAAKDSYGKFAKRGFDDWAKELVNFSANPANTQDVLLTTMQQLLSEVQTLTAKVKKWDKTEDITATIYPGMKMLNDGIGTLDAQKILDNGELYSLCDWLAIKGTILDKSTKLAFARQASDTYKTMTSERPPQKYKPRLKKDGFVK